MKNKFLMKISLLSVSLILTSAASVSSTIPLIQKTFINKSLSSIEMITMIPSFMCMIFVLLSVPISRKIGSKQTVILGLIISLICGTVPVYSNDFNVIMLSRAGLGVGFGLFNSLAISLISDFFTVEERTQMIGFQSAFQGLGGALLTFLAGQFSNINWHMSFSIYFIIVPIIILFILFIPTPPKIQITNINKKKVNSKIYKYIFILFIAMIIYNAIYLKIPTLLIEKEIGTTVDASLILSISQIGGMLTGFVFGYIYKKVKENVLILAFGMMSIAYFITASVPNIMIICASTLISGIAFALFIPYIFNKVAEESSTEEQTFATSILIVGAQTASLISPYCLALFGKIPLVDSEVSQVFISGAIILLALIIGIRIYEKKQITL